MVSVLRQVVDDALPGTPAHTVEVVPESPARPSSSWASVPLRRPTTTDPRSFYYISQEKWDLLFAETQTLDKAKRKVAENNIHKYDSAGRMMETDEGVAAPNPCQW